MAAAGLVFTGSGCLEETNHQAELKEEIERRGVGVIAMELSDGIVTVEYESENTNDDLANVAMAFVDRVADGWQVDQLDGIARDETDLAWHAEAVWAREYLDDKITAAEYGNRISETLAPAVVVGGGDSEE